MNIKTIGILGILVAAVVPYVSHADDIEVFDIEDADAEFDFDVTDFEDDSDATVDESKDDVATVQTRNVASRLTCDDIKKRVSELTADVKAYPELKSELETMLARQRTQCAPRANRRPVHNYENVNPVMTLDVVPVEEVVSEDVIEEAPETKEKEPVKTPEEIAAEEAVRAAENIANGLCRDGAKPNRYGCCANEKFKEVSHLTFACCPKDGDGECHEPLKK